MNPRTSLICGGLALVVMGLAAARVTYSLYDIQIKNGDTYRQLAAKQQLLDTTIKATRGEIYDTSGITLASTSVVWTIWADPDNSKILYTTTGKDEETVRTLDTAMCAEVSRELTLRLLSGDGESLTRWTLPRKRTRPSTRRFTMHFPRRTPSIRCWPPR